MRSWLLVWFTDSSDSESDLGSYHESGPTSYLLFIVVVVVVEWNHSIPFNWRTCLFEICLLPFSYFCVYFFPINFPVWRLPHPSLSEGIHSLKVEPFFQWRRRFSPPSSSFINFCIHLYNSNFSFMEINGVFFYTDFGRLMSFLTPTSSLITCSSPGGEDLFTLWPCSILIFTDVSSSLTDGVQFIVLKRHLSHVKYYDLNNNFSVTNNKLTKT